MTTNSSNSFQGTRGQWTLTFWWQKLQRSPKHIKSKTTHHFYIWEYTSGFVTVTFTGTYISDWNMYLTFFSKCGQHLDEDVKFQQCEITTNFPLPWSKAGWWQEGSGFYFSWNCFHFPWRWLNADGSWAIKEDLKNRVCLKPTFIKTYFYREETIIGIRFAHKWKSKNTGNYAGNEKSIFHARQSHGGGITASESRYGAVDV